MPRAAVLGSPVAHSLSPVLHGAAYTALGLTGWSYERVECDADALPGWVGARDRDWVGLSVTMPGKRAALAVAAGATGRARRLGVANTLARRDDGAWEADCTDVDGVAGALHAAGVHTPLSIAAGTSDAVILGAGATASASVAGLYQVGNELLTLVVRDAARARDTLTVAAAHGMTTRTVRFCELDLAELSTAKALINTTPAGSVDSELARALVAGLPYWAVVLDAVYHPWPTPLAAAALDRGLAVATGLDMLLHQAFGQVERFTGRTAPREAMRSALAEATGFALLPT